MERQLAKFMACLIILGVVLLLRSAYPEDTKAFLAKHIAGGMDYAEVLAETGGSLRDFFSLAPRPESLPGAESPEPSPDAGG